MDMKAFEAVATPANEVAITGEPVTTARAAAKPPVWLRADVLDRVEQVVIVVLWVWFVRRMVNYYHQDSDISHLLPLISETALMAFTVTRRAPLALTMKLDDWLLAIGATAAPMLIQPGYDMFPWAKPLGVTLVLVGNLAQAGAKLSLRRSFGIAPANRGIKVSWAYGLVRHPMYAGYLLVHIGVLLLMPSPLNLMIYVIGWWAQIRRLLAEEALLGQDPAYVAYMAKVRWRLIPGVF